MKGLWLENQRLEFRENLPIPRPGEGEALIRVRLAGICGTDLQLLRGYYPFTGIPGHEFVGEIVDAPSQPSRVGQRVVGEINVACGTCAQCRALRPSHCENRKVLGIKDRHGAFAEYIAVPTSNLHDVPDTVSDEAAVFTEPLAAAVEILQQVHIQPSDSVLVIGGGRLGQLVAQVLATTACDLTVVARYPGQRQRLAQRQIHVVDDQAPAPAGTDIVIEATGSPAALAMARDAVRPRGTIVLKSTYKESVSLDLSRLVVNEVTMLGSRCGPFPPAITLLQRNQVDPAALIDGRYPLDDGVNAFEKAGEKGILKILLTF